MADQQLRVETGRDLRTGQWRSPIRGPWLTSVFGVVLLVGIPVEFVTGLLSYAAYNPRFAGNDLNPDHGLLGFYLFDWATSPAWLYRFVEGVHVVLGLVLLPVVLAKLWSVMPKLFRWPEAWTPARVLDRISLAMLVGGVLFQFFTGILDITYWNVYHFDFYTGHYYGAWLFMIGFVVHVAVKFVPMVRALRSRSLRTELRTGLADTVPEPVEDELVAAEPAEPTISRRGVLALVGGASAAIFVVTAGNSIGGRFRSLALLAPQNKGSGTGGNDFQVNHTAASVGVDESMTGPAWRLELIGTKRVTLSRDELLAMPQITAALPIACTEGWSTTQHWTGVPLAHLAALAGVTRAASARLETLDHGGTTLSGAQVHAGKSMVALRVNGTDLSLDHGFPARVMVPAAPGNYNRKWISRITFAGAG